MIAERLLQKYPIYEEQRKHVRPSTVPFLDKLLRLDDQTTASFRNWKHLKQRFKDYFVLKHKDQKSSESGVVIPPASLLMFISGNKIRDIMKEFSSDIDHEVRTIDDVFENIEDLCLPNFILLYERFKFFSLRQKQFEDLRKFVSELQILGDYCELQEHRKEYVTSGIVDGVYSETLRKHLQSIPDLELEKAIEICNKADKFSWDKCADENHMKSQKRVVESRPYVVNEKKYSLKSTLTENMLPRRCGIRGSRVKSERAKASSVISCSRGGKGAKINSVENAPAASLQQNSSSSLSNCNIKPTKTLTRKRFMKSLSETSASEGSDESLSVKIQSDSVWNTTYQSNKSSCLSDHVVILQSQEAAGQDEISLTNIPENVVMDKIFPVKEMNETQVRLNQDVGVKDLEFDHIDGKDVKVGLEVQNQDKKKTGGNSQSTRTRKLRKCPICGLMFATAYQLKCHTRIHSGQRLYKCGVCHMDFIHCGSRSRHMRQAHSELLKFDCSECDMLFDSQKALDQHKLSHSKEQKVTCNDCGVNFASTREHYQHQRREHRSTRYNCDKCNLHFPYPSKLKLHLMSKHNATKPFMCEICGSSFAEKNMLTTHKNIHSGEKKHECPTCGRRFLLKTTLSNHIQTHLDRKPHTCEICGMGFKLSYYLKSHMKTHSETRERPHICSRCGAAFLKLAQLRNHERKHTGEKPYKCEICNSLFSQLSSMKKHIKQIHEGQKPKDRFACEYCGLSFTHSCKLKLHLMKHTGERPFSCKVCGSTYRENHQLTSHMKIHTGNEPFKCPFCGRRFLQKSSLEGHVRKHTGEKPFECPVCYQHFSHKGYLRDHVKVHDQNRERKYKCSICDKAFTCSSHMRSHERLHSGEKPHKCDICGSRFTKRSSVKKHQRRIHGMQNTTDLQVQNSVAGQNVPETATVILSQLQPLDVTQQGIHPEQHAEMNQGVQHQTHLQTQMHSEMHTELQVNLPTVVRPILHAGMRPDLHSELLLSHIRPEAQSGIHQHNVCAGLHTVHASVHHQMQLHHSIHIIHPDVHPSLHMAVHTPTESQLPPAVTANLVTHIQHPENLQEMQVYTLAS